MSITHIADRLQRMVSRPHYQVVWLRDITLAELMHALRHSDITLRKTIEDAFPTLEKKKPTGAP